MSENTTIHHGDCMQVMKDFADNSINTIVTSPPYNKLGLSGKKKIIGDRTIWKKCNIEYASYSDDMDESEYAEWQIQFIDECYRILKPDGSLFYNHKIRRMNNRCYFPEWVFSSKCNFYQMIVWDRQNYCDMNRNYLYPNTELIFWMTKDKPKVFKNNISMQNEIWRISPSNSKLHPASFPVDLVKNCIGLTTEVGDIVLDPFMGSGTTGVGCRMMHRKFIGIELDENYCKIAEEQIKNIIVTRQLF